MQQTSVRKFSALRLGGISLLLYVAAFFCNPVYAQLTLTSGNSATTTPNVATAITGFQVVGAAASTTPVQLRVTSGTLSMTTTTGLTFDGSSSGSQINFSGTVANINAALATLRYTRGSVGSDTLEVSLVNKGEVFFLDNNHLYKFVAGSYTWDQARIAASSTTLYGASGYLATITSSAENNFVYARIAGDGWLGTTDIETEKTWKWVTGPEAGTSYFQESPGGGGGSPIAGRYNGWSDGEPNDFDVGEDCGYMYATNGGSWNDFPCNTGQGYVVEFGAEGNMPTVVAKNISIVTADVPAVTTLSPVNAATNVSTTTNLVMTFSKNVNKDIGSVSIRRVSDDVLVETILASTTQVTGGGTSVITINPDSILAEGTQYYVIVSNTAFKDASDNYFDGISSSSTWVFTTGDFTAPVLTNVSAVTSSTTATTTWTTNENSTSRVVYGPSSSYGTTTPVNLSSVLSHTVALSGLVPCLTYHYAVVSADSVSNTATSSDRTFTTSGCVASSTPSSVAAGVIASNTGGTTTLTHDESVLSVTMPANFTATSSSVVIQLQTLPASNVLEDIGTPQTTIQKIGAVVFDVKAIIDSTIVLDSFDAPVTITYTYTDSDIRGIEESSLLMYHYHNNAWSALDDCSVNQTTNTITCTAPSFSIFALFGSPNTSSRTYSASYFVTAPVASMVLNTNSVDVVTTSTPVIKKEIFQFTKNLRLGAEHAEVKKLQQFLNAHGFPVASKGVGASGHETTYFGIKTKNALIAFQEANAGVVLTPQDLPRGTGHFLSYTKAHANAILAAE